MPTTISCTRRLEFDAAHRLVQHEGKCRNLHGHRYVLDATFSAPTLDDLGRIVDFAVIKEKLGRWIDEHWDHNTILFEKDKSLGESIAGHTKQNVYYLPSNPTAENMAAYIFDVVCPEIFNGTGITCTEIVLHETPNCKVSAR